MLCFVLFCYVLWVQPIVVTDSYLQFAKPDIMETIKGRVEAGAKRIVLHPFFLNAGMHVTKDIPELIEKAGNCSLMLNSFTPNRSAFTKNWHR